MYIQHEHEVTDIVIVRGEVRLLWPNPHGVQSRYPGCVHVMSYYECFLNMISFGYFEIVSERN